MGATVIDRTWARSRKLTKGVGQRGVEKAQILPILIKLTPYESRDLMPSRTLEAWMWAEACDALARAERMQREFFRLGPHSARPNWEPPVDIYENERELTILTALPGVAAQGIEIGVKDGILMIAGERPAPPQQRAATIHRLEIPQGRFERRIALPAGVFELARHEVRDGCLILVLAKRR